MDCALSASWEADIIILSFVLMMQLLLKNKGGCYSKIIIIMENDDDFTKSINRQVSFDLIFPHSKL
jgi:hypothetical protein